MAYLLEEIASFANLLCAWQQLKNRLVQEEYLPFSFNLEENLICLSDALRRESYYASIKPVRYHVTASGEKILCLVLKTALWRWQQEKRF